MVSNSVFVCARGLARSGIHHKQVQVHSVVVHKADIEFQAALSQLLVHL